MHPSGFAALTHLPSKGRRKRIRPLGTAIKGIPRQFNDRGCNRGRTLSPPAGDGNKGKVTPV